MLNILFPKVCCGCESILSTVEDLICVTCRHDIPLTHYNETSSDILKRKFYGRFPITHAASLIQFQKRGLTQTLMHQMKYRGVQELSRFFGEWLGSEMAEYQIFNDISVVIPVPLHNQKLKKRGYNQVEGFGRALAEALNANYRDDILIKISKSASQVLKNRILRSEMEEVFAVQNIE